MRKLKNPQENDFAVYAISNLHTSQEKWSLIRLKAGQHSQIEDASLVVRSHEPLATQPVPRKSEPALRVAANSN